MATNSQWYKTGTVSTVAGSKVVTGSGTGWALTVKAGDIFTVNGAQLYEVASVESNTSLTLASPYPDAVSGASYAIIRNFTSTLPAELAASLAEMQRRWYQSLGDYVGVLSASADTVTVVGVDGVAKSVKTWAYMEKQLAAAIAPEDLLAQVQAAASSATASKNAAETSASSASGSASTATTKASEAETSAAAALSSKNAAATSASTSSTKAGEASSSAAAAATSAATATSKASEASASAGTAKDEADRAQAAANLTVDAIAATSVPFPDVWIPFNDDLRMLAGRNNGVRKVKIGGVVQDVEDGATVSFSRASTATYIDKSGVLRTASMGEPRFEKEGLLIEGQSTNLFINSSSPIGQYTSAVTVSGNLVTVNSLNVEPRVTISSTAGGTPDGTVGKLSFWVDKSKSSPDIENHLRDVVKTNRSGFVRVERAVIFGSTERLFSFKSNTPVGVFAYVESGQLEANPFATSYIPTNGAAATRAPDYCSIQTDTNAPNNTELTMVAEINGFRQGAQGFIRLFNWSDANRGIWKNGQTLEMHETNAGFVYNYADGVHINQFNLGSGGVRGGVNGTMSDVKSAALMNNLERLTFISNQTGGVGYAHIRNFRIWHTALSDAQIKGLK